MAKFVCGKLVWTAGVNEKMAESAEFCKGVLASLKRHASGDWGDMPECDRKENEYALGHGLRLMSAYNLNDGKIWIITEADRSATTVLFPEEY